MAAAAGVFRCFTRHRSRTIFEEHTMLHTLRILALASAATLSVFASGCAVTRGQSTMGSYVDDTGITAGIKARLLEDQTTGGLSINVDSLNGTVALSGFATSETEKARAEAIARNTQGVKSVRNNLIVRPPTR
jgi:osmotically-inducible protein OsmY